MPKLLEKLVAAVLAAVALQSLIILAFSAAGKLPWCWAGTLLPLALISIGVTRWVKRADPSDRGQLAAAWASPWPWLVLSLLLVQIAVYPPTMHDSLSYRLPRMFMALQEGAIGRFTVADARMNGMPWGWESLALPFASLNLSGWTKLINLGCWALTYQLIHSFARTGTNSPANARRVALALATAPGFLLQAASTANDLYAATLLLAGVWMVCRFHQAPGPVPVMASLLALVLAANAKPQFLTLGLPWLVWWALAPGKPWKRTRWQILALAAPIYLLVSPLPVLAINHHLTGTLVGSEGLEPSGVEPSAWLMMTAGVIQFLSSQFQLPVFPGADAFSALIHRLSGLVGIHAASLNLGPGTQLVPIIDRASFGLIHFLLIITGALVHSRGPGARSGHFLLLAALAGFLFAASRIVPDTIGRSFMGFISLVLPIAAIGLARIAHRPAALCSLVIAILCGSATLVINPSSPLWPSRKLETIATRRGYTGLVSKLETYHAYQLRAETGRGILDPVPAGDDVGLLFRHLTPISPIWTPDWKAHRFQFVHHTPPADFVRGTTRWLLVGDKAAEQFPTAHSAYTQLPGWEMVSEKSYLPNIRQGPETWSLYRKQ